MTERINREQVFASQEQMIAVVRTSSFLTMLPRGCTDSNKWPVALVHNDLIWLSINRPSACGIMYHLNALPYNVYNMSHAAASVLVVAVQIDVLEELGFEPAQIEHICTIAWQLLDIQPDNIKAVAQYVKQQGVDDPTPVLFNNPKLLEYEVQGDELVKGKRARARVTLDKSNGTGSLLVSWYTASTAFAEDSAPIAPWRPE